MAEGTLIHDPCMIQVMYLYIMQSTTQWSRLRYAKFKETLKWQHVSYFSNAMTLPYNIISTTCVKCLGEMVLLLAIKKHAGQRSGWLGKYPPHKGQHCLACGDRSCKSRGYIRSDLGIISQQTSGLIHSATERLLYRSGGQVHTQHDSLNDP